ncbi:MAG: peptidase inhibitor family I36 protein [Spirillospora sp.]
MRKTTATMLGVALAGGLVTAAPATAQAATAQAVTAPRAPALANAPGDCPSQYFCAWRDINFTGTRWQWIGNDTSWHDNNPPGTGGSADQSSSWYNHGVPASVDDVRVYRDTGNLNVLFCLSRGQSAARIPTASDRASSHKWVSTC